MADPELAALRAARLTQLQQSGTNENGQSGSGSEDAEKRRAEEQMRRDLLATALEPAARERRMSNCILSCLSPAENKTMNIQYLVLRSCPPRGRVRSNLFSCECYKVDSSGDVSASSNSSICSSRYGYTPSEIMLVRSSYI